MINIPTLDGDGSCVHTAIHFDRKEMLRLLCAVPSINLGIQDNDGLTPLHLAIEHNRRNLMDILLEYPHRLNLNATTQGTKIGIVHRLIMNNNFNCFCKILRIPLVDLNTKDAEGFTPLLLALTRGEDYSKFTLELLKYAPSRVDINVKDGKGNTPLHYAASGNTLSIFQRLCSFPNVKWNQKRTRDGYSVLHIVAEVGSTDLLDELYLHRDDLNVNEVSMDGMSALHVACLFRHTRVIRKLCRVIPHYLQRYNPVMFQRWKKY